ncbi:LPS export ABC transporter periplasmic protein LptC [Bartonella australis]|nr:LPS export ABC transporter periplasmic protein LptC [Bartonella australis]
MVIRDRYEFFSIKSSFGDVFKEAYHHSIRICLLKFFLLSSALAIALIFCWFTFFSVSASSDTIILNHEESETIKLTMTNPKLEGYTSSRDPYWIKAEKAFQERAHSGMIKLQNITAEAVAGEQGRVFLKAQGGGYDNINGLLRLDKPFMITTTSGAVAHFMAADINLSEGQLKTDQHVDIQHTDFYLTAGALHVLEKGQIMHFQGGVHLTLNK